MKKINLYLLSLFISIPLVIFGLLFKIQHWPFSIEILFAGLFIGSIFFIISLIDIYNDEHKTTFEKLAWLIGFVTFSWIFGLIYYYTHLKGKK